MNLLIGLQITIKTGLRLILTRKIVVGSLLAMADRLGEPKFTGEGIQVLFQSLHDFPSALNELEDSDPVSTSDPVFKCY